RSNSAQMLAVIGSLSNQGPAVTELAAPYLFYLVVAEPRRRMAAFGAIGCALFLVVASQSRGALLLLGVTIALVAVLFGRTTGTKIRRTAALFVVGAGVVAAVWGVLGPGYFSEPIERLQNSRMFDASDIDIRSVDEADYQRTVMYLEGINAIRAHGVTGIGYGALPSYIEAIHGWRLISHNIIVTAWGEMGLAGLALALVIAVVGTRRVWVARASARRVDARAFYFHTATLIAWVVALMHAQFRPQLSNPMFHVLAAAVFAAGVDPAPGSSDARNPG
ncbi:O-antigen ligase family protein, partial [Candidatus Poribacteria bacterium]|nr:O-antigen ligase family protein [Candidatus Poribacteria bacterium]